MTLFPLMRAALLLLMTSAQASVAPEGPTSQLADDVHLSLRREYGRAMYRDCRVDVVVFERQGRTQLHCAWNIEGRKPLVAQRTLSAQEVQELSRLVGASELCGGGHIGSDGRSVDGVLETLLARCAGGQVAVLVTSGNPTFKADAARRQLLDRLHALENELRKSASSK